MYLFVSTNDKFRNFRWSWNFEFEFSTFDVEIVWRLSTSLNVAGSSGSHRLLLYVQQKFRDDSKLLHFDTFRKEKISLTEGFWQYHPKWKQYKLKFSTFFGLPGTTSYPYLPLRMIGHPDNSRHPQGGVQIYPHPNLQHNKENKSTLPQIAIFISCSPRRKKNI